MLPIARLSVIAALVLPALGACQPVPPGQQARRSCMHQTGSRLCVGDDEADDLTHGDPTMVRTGDRGQP